jgi:hypothetical protein
MQEKQYDALKKEFGGWGSWAVWNSADYGDLYVIERHIPSLHTGYVFVGLAAPAEVLPRRRVLLPSWRVLLPSWRVLLPSWRVLLP